MFRISNRKGKALSEQEKAKAKSGVTCSFCWFVLTIYPTLKGMTERDEATYREHLETVHGLSQEIRN